MNYEIKFPDLSVINDEWFNNQSNVYETIQALETFKVGYVTRPSKPHLKSNATPNEIRKYANEIERYESENVVYNEMKSTVQFHNQQVDDLIIDFIKNECGLFKYVPEKYQGKIWSKAWSDGHSSGYCEIYNQLTELVDIFI